MILLFASLSLPNVHLWGASIGAGKAEGQSVTGSCSLCLQTFGNIWCTAATGQAIETSGTCITGFGCTGAERPIRSNDDNQCIGGSSGGGFLEGSEGSACVVNVQCQLGLTCENGICSRTSSGGGTPASGTTAGQACSTIGNLKCDGNELFECKINLLSNVGNTWQSPRTESNCAATCQSEAARTRKTCEGTTTAGSTTPPTATPASICHSCFTAGKNQFFCDTSSVGFLNYFYNPAALNSGRCYDNTQPNIDICVQARGTPKTTEAECPPPPTCKQLCELRSTGGGYYGNQQYGQQYTPLSTIPIGQCTQNPGGVLGGIGSISIGTGSQQVVRPQPIGRGTQYGCSADEFCSCYTINPLAAGSAFGLTGGYAGGSATIPGTTQLPNWNDPAALQNYPSAQPNQLDCDAPSDASVTADIKPKIAQAGETVTVSGEVGKIASTCVGYQRTCRAIRQQAYKVSYGFFKDTYSIQQCPSELPQVIHKECLGQEGKDSCSDWKLTKIIIIAAIAGIATFCGFAAGTCAAIAGKLGITKASAAGASQISAASQAAAVPGATASSVAHAAGYTLGSLVDAAAKAGLATINVATPASTLATITAITPTTINWAAALPLLTTAPALISQYQRQFGSLFGSQYTNTQKQQKPSFSVCAKEYKTDIGYSPACGQGGNVIGFKEGRYSCNPGSCQAFEGKDIEITVYDATGAVAANTTTRTDATGKYSYTFAAPAGEGEYSAVVVVPGLNRNPATGVLKGGNSRNAASGSDAGSQQAVRPLDSTACTAGVFSSYDECISSNDARYCSQCSGIQPLS